jgi:hypothetical protein
LLLRLARITRAACVAQPVALIRQHAGMLSTAHGLAAYTATIRALSTLLHDPAISREVRLAAHRSIGRYHAHVARQLVDQAQWRPARRHALAALANHPFHRPAWRWAARSLFRRPAGPEAQARRSGALTAIRERQ